MAFRLKYNNADPPSFMRITGVDQEILPNITHYNSIVPNCYGNVDGGISFGSKVITVNYMIVKDNTHDDSYYIDAMAAWLIGDNNKVSKLTLDTSGEYFLARPTGGTTVSDAILFGDGSIVFTASDPRRYATSEKSNTLAATSNTTVNYTGIVPVCPVFTMSCSGTTSVKITNTTTGDYVLVSGALTGALVIDCNKKFVSLGGTKDMLLLDIKSDWITLLKGNNVLNVTTTGTAPTNIACKYTIAK